MHRIVKSTAMPASLALVLAFGAGVATGSRAEEPGGRDIPAAFSAFEYLVGRWNGTATPEDSAQRFRGWRETHTWAWIFSKGKPTGLSVTIEGGKVLAEGKLTFDPAGKRYRLAGTAPKPAGGPIAFEGALDASGKLLVLDQVASGERGPAGRGTIRLSIRPNANFIRYTMKVARKDPGESRFDPSTEVGLTKEGESLAGGSTASDRPKCIVTGGAAAMTLTYNGQTFPICCTGCRDEFNENPEKYIKKARLMLESRGSTSKAGQPAPARVSRFEDAFAGDVVDSPAMKSGGRSSKAAPKGSQAKAAEADDETDATPDAGKSQSASKKDAPKAAAARSVTRAAGLLQIARNLEKSGKSEAALENYKRIVKDYADTPAAKTARQRIKAIEKP